MIRCFFVGLVALFSCLIVGNVWGGVLYTVTDLGTLPGCSTSYPKAISYPSICFSKIGTTT